MPGLDWPRGHPHRLVLAVAAACVAVVVDVTTTSSRRQADLETYLRSVQAWVDGGALYDYVKPGTSFGFTYPPFAALLMAPMTLLSWRTIVVVQACLTAVAATGVLAWVLTPLARRRDWPLWSTTAVGLGALVMLVPVRDVMGYGQVNLLLLSLVAADLGWCVTRGHRLAGVGIGLATAVKLVPGLFIVYLLLTRRYRAALTAAGAFGAVTGIAAVVAPHASAEFWLDRCWEVSRVGDASSEYNQSLRGVLLRLGPHLGSIGVWLMVCTVVLAVWAHRVRRLPADHDRVGVALTGLAICLVAPIAWIHHLVWALPALAVAVNAGELVLAASAGAVFSSPLPSLWVGDGWFAHVVSRNAYAWACLMLLVAVPSRDSPTDGKLTSPDRSRDDRSDLQVDRSAR